PDRHDGDKAEGARGIPSGISSSRCTPGREDAVMDPIETPDGADVPIEWTDGRETNLANWENRVPIHERAYETEAFARDPGHLSSVVRTDLAALATFLPDGGVSGLDVCHL